MAKKKKRRSSSGRSAGTATATRAPSSRVADPASVKPAPAREGGPNRLARKEEARRERERIRRKIARRQTLRRAGRWGVAAAVVGGIAFFLFLSNRPKEATAAERATIFRGQRAAQSAGCTPVRTIGEYRDGQDRMHNQTVTGPPLSTYPSTPPTSGPHNPSPLNAGVYSDPPDIWRVIHSLEHGATVIWYAPQVERNPQLQRIKDYFGDPAHNDHVIVAPYNYANQGTAGQLPQGKPIALTAWHHLQTCAQPNFDVVQAFVVQYTADGQGTYRGEAPEAGGAI
jgi:uncharacterized protein DUF3105